MPFRLGRSGLAIGHPLPQLPASGLAIRLRRGTSPRAAFRRGRSGLKSGRPQRRLHRPPLHRSDAGVVCGGECLAEPGFSQRHGGNECRNVRMAGCRHPSDVERHTVELLSGAADGNDAVLRRSLCGGCPHGAGEHVGHGCRRCGVHTMAPRLRKQRRQKRRVEPHRAADVAELSPLNRPNAITADLELKAQQATALPGHRQTPSG